MPVLSDMTLGARQRHSAVTILASLLVLVACDWSIGIHGQTSVMPTEVCLGSTLAASGWRKTTPLSVRESGPRWFEKKARESHQYLLFTSADAQGKSAVHGGMSFVPAASGFDVYMELSGSGRIEDSRGPPLLARLERLYEALHFCGGKWAPSTVNGCTNVECGAGQPK